MFPARVDPVVFDATEKVTVPLPFPCDGASTVSHDAKLCAVQSPHAPVPITSTLPAPPSHPKLLPVAERVYRGVIPDA
jgi:hypothetical protein